MRVTGSNTYWTVQLRHRATDCSEDLLDFFMILIAYFMYFPDFFIIQIWLGG